MRRRPSMRSRSASSGTRSHLQTGVSGVCSGCCEFYRAFRPFLQFGGCVAHGTHVRNPPGSPVRHTCFGEDVIVFRIRYHHCFAAVVRGSLYVSVSPINWIRSHIHSKARKIVMPTRRICKFRFAFFVESILSIFRPMTFQYRTIHRLNNLIEDFL